MRYLLRMHNCLGDLMIDLAVVNAIARADPDCEIEAVANSGYHTLLSENPHIARIYTKEPQMLKRWAFDVRLLSNEWDVFLSLKKRHVDHVYLRLVKARHKRMWTGHKSDNPSEVMHRLSYLEGIVPDWDKDVDVSIRFDESRIGKVRKRLGVSEQTRVLTVCPGSKKESKNWPPEKFAQLINKIKGDYDKVFLLGSAEQSGMCESIAAETGATNLAGEIELLDICALMSHPDLQHIGNDSGLGHVAAGCGSRALAIGSEHGDYRFKPWGQQQIRGDISDIGIDQVLRHLAADRQSPRP